MSNILITQRFYPISIGLYFRRALLEMGHSLWTAGTFSPSIPWAPNKDYGNMLDVPDYIVPEELFSYPIEPILEECPFIPDAIISFDSFFHCLNVKETGIPNAYVMVDPHAAQDHYLQGVEHYSRHFCMQNCYIDNYATRRDGIPRPVWFLPFAADSRVNYWNGTDFSKRPFDVCLLSGLLYPQRKEAIEAMHYVGLNVHVDSAVFYPEASEVYGQAVIAFNWSSALDLCARFWEGLATRNLVLTNRVPDLEVFTELQEDVHYVAFDTLDECISKAQYYSEHRDEAWRIASAGYAAFWAGSHSWTRRAETILDVLGLK